MDGERETVHGTAVAVGPGAVLIRGPSGSGKSDLALRCLGLGHNQLLPQPAALVADDRVHLWRNGASIHAEPPGSIAGHIEVRGLGIVAVPSVASANILLVADLVAPGAYERLPDPRPATRILGLDLPLVLIAPFEASAPLKLLLALTRTRGHGPCC